MELSLVNIIFLEYASFPPSLLVGINLKHAFDFKLNNAH